MTDKQLIETLKNIKEHCEKTNCSECVFHKDEPTYVSACQFVHLEIALDGTPRTWSIKEVEEVVNE